MESDPASLGWRAVHPARFWLIVFAGVVVLMAAGSIARAHLDISFSAVAFWGTFTAIAGPALPIHIRWWLRRVRGPQVGQALRDALGPESVRRHQDFVRCHGLASRAGAARSSGALVMTDGVLAFRPCIGDGDIEIDLDAIVAVDVTREHMGATSRVDLLRVAFADGSQEDTVAWEFPEPRPWLDALRARIPAGGDSTDSSA